MLVSWWCFCMDISNHRDETPHHLFPLTLILDEEMFAIHPLVHMHLFVPTTIDQWHSFLSRNWPFLGCFCTCNTMHLLFTPWWGRLVKMVGTGGSCGDTSSLHTLGGKCRANIGCFHPFCSCNTLCLLFRPQRCWWVKTVGIRGPCQLTSFLPYSWSCFPNAHPRQRNICHLSFANFCLFVPTTINQMWVGKNTKWPWCLFWGRHCVIVCTCDTLRLLFMSWGSGSVKTAKIQGSHSKTSSLRTLGSNSRAVIGHFWPFLHL